LINNLKNVHTKMCTFYENNNISKRLLRAKIKLQVGGLFSIYYLIKK